MKGAEQVKAVFEKFISSTVVSITNSTVDNVDIFLADCFHRRAVRNLLNLVEN